MTEARAKEIVDEVTIALETPERFVQVEDKLPMGTYLMPGIDQQHKHAFVRVRRDWLEHVDEGVFKFGVAHSIVMAERVTSRPRNLLMGLGGFMVALPIIAIKFAGDKLPPLLRTLAWPMAIFLFVAVVIVGTWFSLRDFATIAFERPLRVSRDYEAARRFLSDERKVAGSSALLKAKPKHIERQLHHLEAAARKLGLI